MKKIFTLIAMALVAVSANAKEDIDFSAIASPGVEISLGAWEWKGITLSTGSLIEDKDAKTADDSGVTYYDASAYDYVVVKYSNSTADINLVIQYKCLGTIGQYVAEYNQAQAVINAAAEGSYAALPLDAAQKDKVNQIALQPSKAAKITIEEMYFATEAEWEAVKPAPAQTKDMLSNFTATTDNADGSKTFTGTGDWVWFGAWLGSFDASEFDYLVLELSEPTDIVTQCVIQYVSTDAADNSLQIPAGETLGMVELDAIGKSAIKQLGLQNGTPGSFTVKAIYFATKEYAESISTSISEAKVVEADANAPIYNLAGQRVSKAVKGIYIQNGKKFIVK